MRGGGGGGEERGHLCRHHSSRGLMRVCKSVWERETVKVWICEYVWEQGDKKGRDFTWADFTTLNISAVLCGRTETGPSPGTTSLTSVAFAHTWTQGHLDTFSGDDGCASKLCLLSHKTNSFQLLQYLFHGHMGKKVDVITGHRSLALLQSHRRTEMETCRFYSRGWHTVRALHCGATEERWHSTEHGCILWISSCWDNSVCQTVILCFLRGTYLTIWTGVQRPFWQICPGRRDPSGDRPVSRAGFPLAHSFHMHPKCWRLAGEVQVGWVLPGAGPPPWVLPSRSPAGTGCLCCFLLFINKQRTIDSQSLRCNKFKLMRFSGEHTQIRQEINVFTRLILLLFV